MATATSHTAASPTAPVSQTVAIASARVARPSSDVRGEDTSAAPGGAGTPIATSTSGTFATPAQNHSKDVHGRDMPKDSRTTMLRFARLTVIAWLRFWSYDLAVLCHRRRLDRRRGSALVGRNASRPELIALVCAAVDEASIWYFKPVLCLQRSVVAAAMLRRRGVSCEVVIGVRPAPFESHAWVEVDGQIVNDRPGYQRAFAVLHRF